MRYIFVSGPYSRGDCVTNTREAILAADELLRAGYIPYVPHTTLLWHLVCPHGIEDWYAYDLEWLVKCDALLRLPGDSTGADNEVAYAHEHNIPVFYRMHELVTYEQPVMVPTVRGLEELSGLPDD